MARNHLRFAVLFRLPGIRHKRQNDCYRNQRQPRNQPENAVHADERRNHRPCRNRDAEGHADTRADQRHRLGAVHFLSQIGDQRHHRGGDRSGALNRPADDDSVNIRRKRGDHAAGKEQQEARNDHFFAAEAVGNQPERDLQKGLHDPVNTDCQTDQCGSGTLELIGKQGKDRHDQKQAEHPERVNACQ